MAGGDSDEAGSVAFPELTGEVQVMVRESWEDQCVQHLLIGGERRT